jgi:hypothetical protein
MKDEAQQERISKMKKDQEMEKEEEEKPYYVVIGVKSGNCYFGELAADIRVCDLQRMKDVMEALALRNAQMMCGPVPFPDGVKGWFDLAVNGPSRDCAVSPPVEYAIISEVRDVLTCTDLAAERWRMAPWPKQQRVVPAQAQHSLRPLEMVNR